MATLVALGTGISVGHLTMEAKAWLENADKVLYCISDAASERLLQRLNSTAESLYSCYDEGRKRADTYEDMVARTLECLAQHETVVVAYYGHPGFFVYPSHRAIELARNAGHETIMLPGISSLDCMIADLGLNVASGLQVFEATDLMIRERSIDTGSHVMILQVCSVGDVWYSFDGFDHRHLGSLRDYLLQLYPPEFLVTGYFASQLPLAEPRISQIALDDLTLETIKAVSTLYIPPLRSRPVHLERLREYGLEDALLEDLELVPINMSLDQIS